MTARPSPLPPPLPLPEQAAWELAGLGGKPALPVVEARVADALARARPLAATGDHGEGWWTTLGRRVVYALPLPAGQHPACWQWATGLATGPGSGLLTTEPDADGVAGYVRSRTAPLALEAGLRALLDPRRRWTG